MKNFLIDLPSEGGYALSQGDYEQLCDVRDRLFLMAQFAGVASCDVDNQALLVIRRMPLGHLFGDLSCQVGEVLAALTHIVPLANSAQAH
ncbi:hypothetical protein [Dyella sp. 2HG41-7]|uniref:XAC0095 family protein n=1 Tax=Dyella sp. 2HG41-7 TaxID=2883239 RepID=UPI001F461A0E|nr:hypothetical protein [Dyella sp. 2HG41-7]